MESLLKSFEDDLKDLRTHINFIDKIAKEIDSDSELYDYVTSKTKKKIDYKSIIISIYGLLENYCEKLVITYLEEIQSEITDVNYLSEKLIDNHFVNSISLASKITENRYQNLKHLKRNDVIKNLYDCSTNNLVPYRFNIDAFILNSGNLKHIKVCELFKQLDIDLSVKLNNSKKFNKDSATAFNKIDELVERRNEVAHGNSITEILSTSEIEPLIEFLETYFNEIFQIVNDDICQQVLLFKKKEKAYEINNFRIFKGNIAGFMKEDEYHISKDSLFILEFGESLRLTKIENLIEKKGAITIKIPANIKRLKKLYLLKN